MRRSRRGSLILAIVTFAAWRSPAAANPRAVPGAGAALNVPGASRPTPVGTGRDAPPPTREPRDLDRLRERIVAAARKRLGQRFHGDCSAFVLRTYRDAGLHVAPRGPARSMSEALWNVSKKVVAPRPGDLAFFHDTYDRNHDHRSGDLWTHVGIVESAEGVATVVIHRGAARIERLRMDLSHPTDERTNDRVRQERPGDAPGTRYLAGQLFAAYGSLL